MAENTTGVLDHEDVAGPGRVVPLSELDDFEVADGYPEVRGWDVRDSGGRSIGYVYDLLVDVEALRVRYLDVELDPEFAGGGADRRVLIPLESAALDGSGEDVILRGIDAAEVHSLVPYARRGVTVEREAPLAASTLGVGTTLPPRETDANFYGDRHYDDARRFVRDDVATPIPVAADRVVRSEEELSLSRRDVDLGEVGLRKTVETERVTERVPVVRDDVDVERRPLRPGEQFGAAELHGDEIRIPIMAEELVVEKRLVTKEVLIIRKRRVTEERTVEADLRRERIEIDDPGGHVRGADASPGNLGGV